MWRTCNALLWKGKIVQDTPDEIAKALTNQSEVSQGVISNSYMHVMYIAIVNLEITLIQQTFSGNVYDKELILLTKIVTCISNKFCQV